MSKKQFEWESKPKLQWSSVEQRETIPATLPDFALLSFGSLVACEVQSGGCMKVGGTWEGLLSADTDSIIQRNPTDLLYDKVLNRIQKQLCEQNRQIKLQKH